MTVLYICGPMTGYPALNFPAFNKAASLLLSFGFEVFNPADQGVVEGWAREDYLKYDLPHLLRCDGVATLTGWQESWGACLEVHNANQLKISVRPVQIWLESFLNPLAGLHSGTVL